mmetsp:Transcript_31265/g.74254  ORF Transcript_31265/g.74254 Transcript_31265/m.74254 type:complete len:212 (+) Transcript_31265:1273-1908(+)
MHVHPRVLRSQRRELPDLRTRPLVLGGGREQLLSPEQGLPPGVDETRGLHVRLWLPGLTIGGLHAVRAEQLLLQGRDQKVPDRILVPHEVDQDRAVRLRPRLVVPEVQPWLQNLPCRVLQGRHWRGGVRALPRRTLLGQVRRNLVALVCRMPGWVQLGGRVGVQDAMRVHGRAIRPRRRAVRGVLSGEVVHAGHELHVPPALERPERHGRH